MVSKFDGRFRGLEHLSPSPPPLSSRFYERQRQLIFNPEAGGKDFAAQATDGGLASMVMRSVSMCDKVQIIYSGAYTESKETYV